MNERFKELPEVKQRAVLNAAMEVFAKYDYKKASTDLIAAKAGISKGLLFYYFLLDVWIKMFKGISYKEEFL